MGFLRYMDGSFDGNAMVHRWQTDGHGNLTAGGCSISGRSMGTRLIHGSLTPNIDSWRWNAGELRADCSSSWQQRISLAFSGWVQVDGYLMRRIHTPKASGSWHRITRASAFPGSGNIHYMVAGVVHHLREFTRMVISHLQPQLHIEGKPNINSQCRPGSTDETGWLVSNAGSCPVIKRRIP